MLTLTSPGAALGPDALLEPDTPALTGDPGPGLPAPAVLLQEDGFHLLQEDGSLIRLA